MQHLISKVKKMRGFSLTEMSVVLISVAALTTMAVGGYSLVKKAEFGDIITDINKFSKATIEFENQYKALPGDTVNVTALPSGALAGDGNSIINTNDEAVRFWQHLSLTGLIEGKYSGVASQRFSTGVGVPSGPVKGSGYAVRISGSVAGVSKNALVIEFTGIDGASDTVGILSAEDAKSIDDKIDDGLPSSGIVRALGSGCASASAYNVNSKSINCRLLFIIKDSKAEGASAISGTCNVLGQTRESPDSTQTCPIGFVGKVIETCRVSNSSTSGAWEISNKYCDPIKCSADSKFGDVKTLPCINGHTGNGIKMQCTTEGVWKVLVDNCTAPSPVAASPSCSLGERKKPVACSWASQGSIVQTCNGSNQWVTDVSGNTCTGTTCAGVGSVGDKAVNLNSCGTNYTGNTISTCMIDGVSRVTINKCVPKYGSCTAGASADKDIGCPDGETGQHIQTCIDADSDYWATKSDTCQPIKCGKDPLGAVRISEGAKCPYDADGIVYEICVSDGGSPPKGIWITSNKNCANNVCNGKQDKLGFAIWPNKSANSTATADSCEPGYKMAAAMPTRFCGADGGWSNTITNPCVRTQCPAGAEVAGVWPVADSNTKNVVTNCNWPTVEGAVTGDCSVDGEWTNVRGFCSKVDDRVTQESLRLWLDANDFTSVRVLSSCTNDFADDADVVGCWMDKSGYENNAIQSTAANQSQYIINAINGRPALKFDGTNDSYVLPDYILPNGNEKYTIHTVSQINNVANVRVLLHLGNYANNKAIQIRRGANQENILSWWNNDISGDITTFKNSIPQIISAKYDGSTRSIYTNGVLLSSQSTSVLNIVNAGENRVGIGNASNYPFSGYISEILIYNDVVDGIYPDAPQFYLGDKYGINVHPHSSDKSTLWLDADDSHSVFSDIGCSTEANQGDSVNCWRDKGRYLNNFTAASSNPPVYKRSVQNGKSAIDFTPPDRLELNILGSELASNNEVTFFSAYKNDTAVTNFLFLHYTGSSGVGGNRLSTAVYNGGNINFDFGTCCVANVGRNSATAQSYYLSKWNIMALRAKSSGEGTIWINGAKASAGTFSSSFDVAGTGPTFVGGDDTTKQISGMIGEILIFNNAYDHTVGNAYYMPAISRYLGDKWGVGIISAAGNASDLKLWLDASDPKSLYTDSACSSFAADGQAIACWRNKAADSSVTSATTSVVANKPLYNNKGMSGYPTLTFDGANNYLEGGPLGISGSNGATIFTVQNMSPSSTSNSKVFGFGKIASPTDAMRKDFDFTTGNSLIYRFNNTPGNSIYKSPFNLQNPNVIAWSWANGADYQNHYVYINGVKRSPSSCANCTFVPTVSDQEYLVGNGRQPNGAKSSWWNGNISEIMVYSTTLSEDEISYTSEYLAGKWGVSMTDTIPLTDNLVLWLDAQDVKGDGSMPLNNDYVDTWVDKSIGTNSNAVSSGSSRPQFKRGGINGLPSLYFDGVNDYMSIPYDASLNPSSLTIMTVLQVKDTPLASDGYILSASNHTAKKGFDIFLFLDTGKMNTRFWTGEVIDDGLMSGGYIQQNEGAIVTWMAPDNYKRVYIGGATKKYHSVGFTANATSDTYVGRYSESANYYYRDMIGEIIMYSSVLSNSNRVKMETFLADKWGIRHEVPRTIGGLAAWYDAVDNDFLYTDAACTTKNVGYGDFNVGCWKDKKDQTTVIKQGTAANRPLRSDSINSITALTFDGNDFLTSATNTYPLKEFTIFAVGSTNDNNDRKMFGNYVINCGYNLGMSGMGAIKSELTDVSANHYFMNVAGTASVNATSVITNTNPFQINWMWDKAANQKMRVNGVGFFSQAASGQNVCITSLNYFRVGAEPWASPGPGTKAWLGKIGEIIMYERPLTDSEINRIEKYLKSKWFL